MARRATARAVNSIMTATYWEIGRRIVEVEQSGAAQAEYGDELIQLLGADLTARFGRGFSSQNIYRMRSFYVAFKNFSTLSRKFDSPISPTLPAESANSIRQTPSVESVIEKKQTPSAQFSEGISQTPPEKFSTLSRKLQVDTHVDVTSLSTIAACFPLPWSHYVKLLAVQDQSARQFYEQEALRGGWSVRQLDRQIASQFYQRTLLSKSKVAMLRKGSEPRPEDLITADEEIKDPLVLEFLDLKDEYSEHDLEEALIHKLEAFLLELGGDFTFVGRQKRLRVGDEWYRIDLMFFHRRLRCLVVIDLKIGKFTHADAGQMHLYLNYAKEHWTHEGENPPVGLILCAQKNEAVAHYSLEGLPNKVMAREYRLALPDEALLAAELTKTQRALEQTERSKTNSRK